jgi:hypothetical protein
MGMTPNDYYIVACCPTKGTVTIFDRTQKKPYNFPLFAKDKKGLDVYTVFFTNDESKCVVSSATKCCIIDLIAMKSIAQFGNTRNPEAVYSIVNDKYYCTITKKKAYIREIKDGKLYKEFSAPPLINNSYNSCVTLQRNSPDGKFFAQVVQYTQSSWSARDDSSYDIVYIWDCSGIDHYTYLTIEQVLLLREIIKNNNIQVYTCGDSAKECEKHSNVQKSHAYWSMPQNLKKQLRNHIQLIPCSHSDWKESGCKEQLHVDQKKSLLSTLSDKFLSKKTLYPLAGTLLGSIMGFALGHIIADKLEISDRYAYYSTIGISSAINALVVGSLLYRNRA